MRLDMTDTTTTLHASTPQLLKATALALAVAAPAPAASTFITDPTASVI